MKLYYRIQNVLYDFRRRCQRFKRGWAYGDVWNMDGWFIRTVKPMLIHLKNEGMGYPIELKDRSEWVSVLDEMIGCLDFMDEDYCIKKLGFSENDGYKSMTGEDWNCIYTMMAENKNRFFELFGEYYFDLWD